MTTWIVIAALLLVAVLLLTGKRPPEVPISDLAPPSEEVRAALRSGNKIEAIKLYRQQEPRAGLAAAKQIVEQIR